MSIIKTTRDELSTDQLYAYFSRCLDEQTNFILSHVPGRTPLPIEQAVYDVAVAQREGMALLVSGLCSMTMEQVIALANSRARKRHDASTGAAA